ncbi:unnamed protein product [Acanthoscelides obtectus]|uniref:Uncharacterized protein n=1 Tax=Acanthoscelides obtectus TaxID=200917 RepID=A0A9P0PLK5_ACAOB|nr:unnamed protein product [Acanthoscelides obtectus]CAK1633020.1 hypothetical protein AOBTE_LOCUS7878 [Acanthoscelides obtectus]
MDADAVNFLHWEQDMDADGRRNHQYVPSHRRETTESNQAKIGPLKKLA